MMKELPTRKGDMLEIYEDNGKYLLRYPTFNVTMPEVEKEISKEAVESYLRGEHTGEELINYAHYNFWKSKTMYSQEESDRIFLRKFPHFILKNQEKSRKLFSKEEFDYLLKQAKETTRDDD